MMPSRRDAIKTVAWVTAFSKVAGSTWATSLLAEVQQFPDFTPGVLRIDLNDFPALSEPFGSVRIGTFPVSAGRKTEAWLKPILINRGAEDQFYVLSAVCTHEGCILPKYNPEDNVILCPEDQCGHGSQFEIDGQVRNGPANSPLDAYSFSRSGSVLTIEVPGLFYDITFHKAANDTRMAIQFVAFYQTRYEVYFRESIDAPPQLVNFSLTENGPATQSELIGNENSEYATIYLDRPGMLGFFQVAVKTSEV
jgi:Rieske Fe-S protein